MGRSAHRSSGTGRVLVVEDNYLLAEVICDFIIECELQPVGPAIGLESGLAVAREGAIDAAILDINLNGQFCFPICAALAARGIPFAFLTGYGQLSLVPSEFRSAPLICKPFEPEEMQAVLQMILSGRMEGPLTQASPAASN
jgi:DNA-binding response OmpR family regulator